MAKKSAGTFRYFWVFVFDQAGRAELDAKALRGSSKPIALASQAVVVVTEHFVPLRLHTVMNVDVAHESGTTSKAKGPKYDIQVMPIEGGKAQAGKWLASKGKKYRDNAIAYRLCRIVIDAAGHEMK
jgi:hypothetical protein